MPDGSTHIFSEEKLKPYFWIYAPVGDVEFKKPKDRRLKTLSDIFDETINRESVKGFYPIQSSDLHCTVMEQPRCPETSGEFRWQPLSNEEDIKDTIKIVRSFAQDIEPVKMSGAGLEVIKRRNRGLLAMNINAEAVSRFQSLYTPMMEALSHIKLYDLYKGERIPKVVLAKTARLESKEIRALKEKIARDFKRIKTKPFTMDRFVLGQGFFTVRGQCIGRRRIATIHTSGAVDRHCSYPFDAQANKIFIKNSMLKMVA